MASCSIENFSFIVHSARALFVNKKLTTVSNLELLNDCCYGVFIDYERFYRHEIHSYLRVEKSIGRFSRNCE